MRLSETEYEWLAKAVNANPRLSKMARAAVSSSKFALSPVYRKFVADQVLTEEERAELCKMVWDRFKISINGCDAIFPSVVRSKLPNPIYRDFQRYMALKGIHLLRKTIGGSRVYTVETPVSFGERFKWFCVVNQRLANEHNVQFCDIPFTPPYFALVDAYARNQIDLDYLRKTFGYLLKREYYGVFVMAKSVDAPARGSVLSHWKWEGKVMKVGKGLYKVNCQSLQEVLRRDAVQVSPQSA